MPGLSRSIPIELLSDPFAQIAFVLALATAAGLILTRLRQPLLLAFLTVGFIVGPGAFQLLSDHGAIDIFGELGVSLLLFLVGLRLDIRSMRSIGITAVTIGISQVVVTGFVGYGTGLLLGYDSTTSLYIGAAISLSSTVVIVKVLSDRREIDSLHGRLSVGYLIVQDVIAIGLLVALGASHKPDSAGSNIGGAIIKGTVAVGLAVALSKYIVPWITARLTEPRELGVIFALSWAFSTSLAAEVAGLGAESGAFLGGVALATMINKESIAASLGVVRDFLILFFFVAVGTNIDLRGGGSNVLVAIAIGLLVSVIKPTLLILALAALGYRRRTAFLVGLSSGQISEFSIILLGAGVEAGAISSDTFSIISIAAMLSFATSIYLMSYAQRIYNKVDPVFPLPQRKEPWREMAADQLAQPAPNAQVILFGLGRLGGAIRKRLDDLEVEIVGIDFDPERIRQLKAEGLNVYLGDAEDTELLKFLPIETAKLVISSVRQIEDNKVLAAGLRAAGYEGLIVLAAHTEDEAHLLAAVGADMMLLPFEDAADRAREMVEQALAETDSSNPSTKS